MLAATLSVLPSKTHTERLTVKAELESQGRDFTFLAYGANGTRPRLPITSLGETIQRDQMVSATSVLVYSIK